MLACFDFIFVEALILAHIGQTAAILVVVVVTAFLIEL